VRAGPWLEGAWGGPRDTGLPLVVVQGGRGAMRWPSTDGRDGETRENGWQWSRYTVF